VDVKKKRMKERRSGYAPGDEDDEKLKAADPSMFIPCWWTRHLDAEDVMRAEEALSQVTFEYTEIRGPPFIGHRG
jgi:hypothetical protein